jgi:hypothetical protein
LQPAAVMNCAGPAMTSMEATSRSCRPTRTGSMAPAMGWAARARNLLAHDPMLQSVSVVLKKTSEAHR